MILPEISRYVKTFNVKDGNEYKNNKLLNNYKKNTKPFGLKLKAC